MNLFISTWVLLIAGLFFLLPMIYMRVTDHTEEETSVPFSSLFFSPQC